MIVTIFILCLILGFLLAMEKFNERESIFISFLSLLLNAGITNVEITLVYREPYWPFYVSVSGWSFTCMMLCIN